MSARCSLPNHGPPSNNGDWDARLGQAVHPLALASGYFGYFRILYGALIEKPSSRWLVTSFLKYTSSIKCTTQAWLLGFYDHFLGLDLQCDKISHATRGILAIRAQISDQRHLIFDRLKYVKRRVLAFRSLVSTNMTSRFHVRRPKRPHLRVEQEESAFSGPTGTSRWSNKGSSCSILMPKSR